MNYLRFRAEMTWLDYRAWRAKRRLCRLTQALISGRTAHKPHTDPSQTRL